jgi:hypothetical protein
MTTHSLIPEGIASPLALGEALHRAIMAHDGA